jgi:DNA repair protein RadC
MKTKSSQKLRVRENVHVNHRSRIKNKFIDSGFSSFAEHEMLEMLLFFSIPQADTNPTAHRLIDKFGSLKGVFDSKIENLMINMFQLLL